MNLIALELPEDKSKWPRWFETQLVGPELRSLVRQLELLAGKPSSLADEKTWDERLNAQFAEKLPAILSRGLSSLSAADLQRFIREPRLLLALQERVFIVGGEYWQSISRSDGERVSVESVLAGLRSDTGRGTSTSLPKPSNPKSSWLSLQNAIYLAAIAATILLAIVYVQPATSGRFFARQGLLTASIQGNAFCKSLSEAVQKDWDSDASAPSFRVQLQALKDSCDRLINAELKQLDAAVANDLRARCQKWQATLTKLLADLDSGRPVVEVRQDANQLVDKLVAVLSELG
jgi:hypothetical protein